MACVLMLGAAAPARAWCEATCGAPVTESTSHCPTHNPADGTTALSASLIDNCPVPESARPTASARLDVQAALTGIDLPAPIARTHLLSCVRQTGGPDHGVRTLHRRCESIKHLHGQSAKR